MHSSSNYKPAHLHQDHSRLTCTNPSSPYFLALIYSGQTSPRFEALSDVTIFSVQFSPWTIWVMFFCLFGCFFLGGWGHEGQSIQQASSSSLFLRRPSWVVLAWAGTSILCHCPSVTICGRGKNYGKLMVTQWKVVEKMCMMYIMYCDGRNKLCAHEMSFAVAVMGRLAQWNSWNKILVTDHPSFRTTLSAPSPSKFRGNYPWPRTIPFFFATFSWVLVILKARFHCRGLHTWECFGATTLASTHMFLTSVNSLLVFP